MVSSGSSAKRDLVKGLSSVQGDVCYKRWDMLSGSGRGMSGEAAEPLLCTV